MSALHSPRHMADIQMTLKITHALWFRLPEVKRMAFSQVSPEPSALGGRRAQRPEKSQDRTGRPAWGVGRSVSGVCASEGGASPGRGTANPFSLPLSEPPHPHLLPYLRHSLRKEDEGDSGHLGRRCATVAVTYVCESRRNGFNSPVPGPRHPIRKPAEAGEAARTPSSPCHLVFFKEARAGKLRLETAVSYREESVYYHVRY